MCLFLYLSRFLGICGRSLYPINDSKSLRIVGGENVFAFRSWWQLLAQRPWTSKDHHLISWKYHWHDQAVSVDHYTLLAGADGMAEQAMCFHVTPTTLSQPVEGLRMMIPKTRPIMNKIALCAINLIHKSSRSSWSGHAQTLWWGVVISDAKCQRMSALNEPSGRSVAKM